MADTRSTPAEPRPTDAAPREPLVRAAQKVVDFIRGSEWNDLRSESEATDLAQALQDAIVDALKPPNRDPVPAPKVGDYVIRQITAIVDGKPVFGAEPAPRERSIEQLAVLLDPLERRLLLIEPQPEREKARRLMWELRNALALTFDYLERRGDALRNERDKAVRANELAAREDETETPDCKHVWTPHWYRHEAIGRTCVRCGKREAAPRSPAREWQPIETAPKDGAEVLLRVKSRAGVPGKMLVGHFMPGGHCIEDHPAIDQGWYFWNGRMFDRASAPTHWMPLPDPPSSSSETKT